MAKGSKCLMVLEHVEASLARFGVLPVVQLPDPVLAVPLVDALSAGGLSVLEITFRAAGAVEAIAAIRAERPDVLVGGRHCPHGRPSRSRARRRLPR